VYYTYAEEADDTANKVSQRPKVRPAGEHIVNKFLTITVITACKVVITSELVSNHLFGGMTSIQ
jgi:hypothetical protein